MTVSASGASRRSGVGLLPAGLHVRVDQQLCTGDGLCVQLAPTTFEFDIDGLAYVKGDDGELRTDPGALAPVPDGWVLEVLESARDCPGECIHVIDGHGTPVAGPEAG